VELSFSTLHLLAPERDRYSGAVRRDAM